VTQKQYKLIMGNNPAHFQGLDHPVEVVSWSNGVTFCERLTARERKAGHLSVGFKYELPTEEPILWDKSWRMRGGFMICTGMCVSGVWIG